MSAPLKLNTAQLRALATALDELTRITKETGVDFSSCGQLQAEIDSYSLQVGRNNDNEYMIDDVNGY